MQLPGADGQPFSYSTPVLADRTVRVVFGAGTLRQIAAEARTLGDRIMIISGGHGARAAAMVAADMPAPKPESPTVARPARSRAMPETVEQLAKSAGIVMAAAAMSLAMLRAITAVPVSPATATAGTVSEWRAQSMPTAAVSSPVATRTGGMLVAP